MRLSRAVPPRPAAGATPHGAALLLGFLGYPALLDRSRVGTTRAERSRGRPHRLHRRDRGVPRPARDAHVPERAPVPREAVRVHAEREDLGAAARSRGLGQRVGDSRAAQLAARAGRAAQFRVRDDRRQRPHEHHHEPRARARGRDGPGRAVGSPLANALPRQGHAGRRTARIDPLLLPDDARGGGAALVPRGRRDVSRHVDGRGPRPCAERVRRDGLPRHGQGRRSLLRPARPRLGGHEDRLPAADQLVPVRDALHAVARPHVLAREGGRVGRAARRQPGLLCRAVPARVRRHHRGGLAPMDCRRARLSAAEPRRQSANSR